MKVKQTVIRLDGMRFYARHGVLPQERSVGGHYTVSLRLVVGPCPGAVGADRLEATVNYAEAYALVRGVMAEPSALLERVAGRILEAVFRTFPLVDEATVVVSKDTPPIRGDIAGGASVELTAVR